MDIRIPASTFSVLAVAAFLIGPIGSLGTIASPGPGATQVVTGAPTSGAETTSRWPADGVTSVSVAVGAFAVRRFRRVFGPPDRLLEAGRRIARACDGDEIARIARVEAIALAGADQGAFLRVSGAGITAGCDIDALFPGLLIDSPVMERVVATGRTINSTDQVSPGAPLRSILAVPVMGGDTAFGVIVLTRSPHDAFGDREERMIGNLVPTVAAAIVATSDPDAEIEPIQRTA